ncbi:hypothetical protein DUI87_03731 [Hirundo rustica rustica]|uniref:Golgi membrane protein 1 n=1 Tax=Hirundo rustica rustica TaxID=333673 RepID=A0A3M0LJ71_HIRRU|nr:hypothetical protein DUI87_03731 [Hirundo rustica rustica]
MAFQKFVPSEAFPPLLGKALPLPLQKFRFGCWVFILAVVLRICYFLEMVGLGNSCRGMKSPPLLMAALVACIIVLGFNYWIANSRSMDLQGRVMDLEGKVRRAAAERGAVEQKKNEFQGELEKQRQQIDKIQSLHSFQMENANRAHQEEKAILVSNITVNDRLIQSLREHLKDLQTEYGKLQLDVYSFQKNQTNLQRKFSYDLGDSNCIYTDCHKGTKTKATVLVSTQAVTEEKETKGAISISTQTVTGTEQPKPVAVAPVQKKKSKSKSVRIVTDEEPTRVSAIRSRCPPARERGYTPQGNLWSFLREHGEDMRKWDGKPISSLAACVRELKRETPTTKSSSRVKAAPVSQAQNSRQYRKDDMTDPLEGTSGTYLQEESNVTRNDQE